MFEPETHSLIGVALHISKDFNKYYTHRWMGIRTSCCKGRTQQDTDQPFQSQSPSGIIPGWTAGVACGVIYSWKSDVSLKNSPK